MISDVEVEAFYLEVGFWSYTYDCPEFYPNLKTFTCGFELSSASGLELAYMNERLQNLCLTSLKHNNMKWFMPMMWKE